MSFQVVNKLLYVIFGVQLVLVTIADVMANVWLATPGSRAAWYLHPANNTAGNGDFELPGWIGYWFTFFGLFNNFVPM